MGGIGSLHCVGMCGPIALSLPVGNESYSTKFIATLLYNLGRVVTYTCIGLMAGFIGNSFSLFGFGQWLSVIIGILIILFVVFQKNQLTKNNFIKSFLEYIRKVLGNLLSVKKYHSVFYIGLLNGLLPCGLLYMAIAGAIATASITKSSLFMAAFGLGTLPLMWAVSFWGSFIKMNRRIGIKKVYPYIMLAMAILLIVRGLGLGIPYVSPSHTIEANGVSRSIGCHD